MHPVNIAESNATTFVKPAEVRPLNDLSTRPLLKASIVFEASGKEIPVPYKAEVLVGREDKDNGNLPDIDLTDIDTSKVTSRRHSFILYSEGLYKIKDLGSINGTFLNGVKLENGVEYDLKGGDEIIFGKIVCTFNY